MTLTYCKGLPTPANELNELGFTQLEMFLSAYAPIFHKAACETVNYLLAVESFNKSNWNTHLQLCHGINKRQANGVISYAKGLVEGARECRSNHLSQLQSQLKSTQTWIKKSKKKLKDAYKFYSKKNWQNSKTGCRFPLSCSTQFKQTNWQNLKFQIHHKKRKAYLLERKIVCLQAAPIRVKVPKGQVFIVGSKDETLGNQACQWDGKTIKIRVPACLEPRFGKYVTSNIGGFERNINRLPEDGAKTWHFYFKDGRWCAAVQFTPKPVEKVSRHSRYGCIGIDLNPGSVGWSYVDQDGNLKAYGRIPLQQGLPSGKQDAQIVDACLQIAVLAAQYSCPVVCEELDFSKKKAQLREQGVRYARMMSGWAYSRFYQLLDSILSNRGIDLLTVNPAYSSLIGLVKYLRMYGLSSDCAAALVIARRGMRLSEKIPIPITASLSVKEGQHVWGLWNQLNRKLKHSSISRRHDYYAISNWEFLANLQNLKEAQSLGMSVEGLTPFCPLLSSNVQ